MPCPTISPVRRITSTTSPASCFKNSSSIYFIRASGASHPNLPSKAFGSEDNLFSSCKNKRNED